MATETAAGETYASLVLIDVSWIKELNDSLDYSCGNIALKLLIQKLKEGLQESVDIYRLSGLEFAMLLPGQTSEECLEKLQTIKNDVGILKIHHRDSEIPLIPDFTIGIVMFEYKENLTLLRLLEQARQTLATARRTDRV